MHLMSTLYTGIFADAHGGVPIMVLDFKRFIKQLIFNEKLRRICCYYTFGCKVLGSEKNLFWHVAAIFLNRCLPVVSIAS